MTEYEKTYWDLRYSGGIPHDSTSGYGSYGVQLTRKLTWMKDNIEDHDVQKIVEFGCGDFNFGRGVLALFPFSDYVGLDVSDVIVKRNQELFKSFKFKNIAEEAPQGDLVMCVDVLFHIIEDDEVEKLLARIEKSWTKYLIITAYERDEEMHQHVRIRKFDYSRFGIPIVREIVEEDGELYFYIFKR